MDFVRRIVSGKKARYEQDGVSLDLVYLTERIIIMGYPASGVEALYRNERKRVLKFLQSRHADNFHLVNLCPRCENGYDAADFGGRVARFPFEDHLPPPLSLIPIYTDWATRWMADPEHVLVIHCKAGKGRSGTFAVSYLLTLPGLPSAPALPNGSALDPRPAGEEALSLSIEDKVEAVLAFHTKRRMAEGTTSRGVSISSQRRFIGYWGRILDGHDPRPKVSPNVKMRRVRLEGVRLHGPGLEGVASKLGHGKVSAHVLRYKDGVATRLRERELALPSDPTEPNSWGDDSAYDDEEEMLVPVGLLSETSVIQSGGGATSGADADLPEDATGELNVRALLPAAAYLPPGTKTRVTPWSREDVTRRTMDDGGIVLDADREFQLKLLVGRTGSKHAKLHTMLALGVVWAIPSFESTADSGGVCSLRLPANEVDFLKTAAGVDAVEVLWRWL